MWTVRSIFDPIITRIWTVWPIFDLVTTPIRSIQTIFPATAPIWTVLSIFDRVTALIWTVRSMYVREYGRILQADPNPIPNLILYPFMLPKPNHLSPGRKSKPKTLSHTQTQNPKPPNPKPDPTRGCAPNILPRILRNGRSRRRGQWQLEFLSGGGNGDVLTTLLIW